MSPLKLLVLSVTLLFTSQFGLLAAETSDPKVVLEASIDDLLTRFTTNRAELEADSSKLYALATDVTSTGWSFDKMARLVLGKNWRKITATQQADFTHEFKQLLIRTYASAMFKYTGKEAISFGRTNYKNKDKTRAIVNAQGSLGNGSPSIPLSFSYFKNKAGAWNIYNISVDGVSLVTVYRVSYNNYISTKGIDHLIESLHAKNNK